uniref:Uncharacterized protein n=1 Tax=Pongo abelii TaxID=9601 RepID=H2NF63_PONAB
MEDGTRVAWLGRGGGLGPWEPLALWASVSREEQGSRAAGPPDCGVLRAASWEQRSAGLLRCASSNCWETPPFNTGASLSWAVDTYFDKGKFGSNYLRTVHIASGQSTR